MRYIQERVNFMSPIVIRKELESLLVQEGEKVLREVNFINEHADLYWNLFYGKYLRIVSEKLNRNHNTQNSKFQRFNALVFDISWINFYRIPQFSLPLILQMTIRGLILSKRSRMKVSAN